MKDRREAHIRPTRVAALVLFACAGAAAIAAAHHEPATAKAVNAMLAQNVGASAAAIELTLSRRPLDLLDGSRFAISSHEGQVVVVNFWATWCRRCVHELPALDAMSRDIAGRGGRVVAISLDQDRRNVVRYVRARALKLPIAHEGPSGLARELDLKQLPMTLVLDRSGAVAWCSSRTDAQGLADTRAAVERLLSAPIPTRAGPATAGDAP